MTRVVPSFFLEIVVQPRAKRTQLIGWQDSALKIQVNAPPVDGAANSAVIELLAGVLGIARSKLSLVRGASSRHKRIAIAASEADCRVALERAVDRFVDKKRPRD